MQSFAKGSFIAILWNRLLSVVKNLLNFLTTKYYSVPNILNFSFKKLPLLLVLKISKDINILSAKFLMTLKSLVLEFFSFCNIVRYYFKLKTICIADAPCRDHKGIGELRTERCRSYRSYKYIPFTHYQSPRNSYNTYTFMIRSNRNLFRVFPTRVSPALRYPNKVVRYSAGLRTTTDQI